MEPAVSATLEDYLEAILRLGEQKGSARVRDIADVLSVHKSTVTAALRSLAEKSLINYSPYEYATLTLDGRRIAEKVNRSHSGIRRFLTEILLLDEQTANENACRMEHVMDGPVTDRLDLFARFLNTRKVCGTSGTAVFADFLKRQNSHPARVSAPCTERNRRDASRPDTSSRRQRKTGGAR